MSKPEEQYRKILLSEEINHDSTKDTIKAIMAINRDDDLKEADYRDWERKPIKLFINSFGGSVYDGLAIVDIIKQSKTPVHTISIGSSMSMGFWIYLAGHKRYVGEHTTLMFHDISTWVGDKSEHLKQETLDDYIIRKAEWYIPADEAIKLKLADGYYKEN